MAPHEKNTLWSNPSFLAIKAMNSIPDKRGIPIIQPQEGVYSLAIGELLCRLPVDDGGHTICSTLKVYSTTQTLLSHIQRVHPAIYGSGIGQPTSTLRNGHGRISGGRLTKTQHKAASAWFDDLLHIIRSATPAGTPPPPYDAVAPPVALVGAAAIGAPPPAALESYLPPPARAPSPAALEAYLPPPAQAPPPAALEPSLPSPAQAPPPTVPDPSLGSATHHPPWAAPAPSRPSPAQAPAAIASQVAFTMGGAAVLAPPLIDGPSLQLSASFQSCPSREPDLASLAEPAQPGAPGSNSLSRARPGVAGSPSFSIAPAAHAPEPTPAARAAAAALSRSIATSSLHPVASDSTPSRSSSPVAESPVGLHPSIDEVFHFDDHDGFPLSDPFDPSSSAPPPSMSPASPAPALVLAQTLGAAAPAGPSPASSSAALVPIVTVVPGAVVPTPVQRSIEDVLPFSEQDAPNPSPSLEQSPSAPDVAALETVNPAPTNLPSAAVPPPKDVPRCGICWEGPKEGKVLFRYCGICVGKLCKPCRITFGTHTIDGYRRPVKCPHCRHSPFPMEPEDDCLVVGSRRAPPRGDVAARVEHVVDVIALSRRQPRALERDSTFSPSRSLSPHRRVIVSSGPRTRLQSHGEDSRITASPPGAMTRQRSMQAGNPPMLILRWGSDNSRARSLASGQTRSVLPVSPPSRDSSPLSSGRFSDRGSASLSPVPPSPPPIASSPPPFQDAALSPGPASPTPPPSARLAGPASWSFISPPSQESVQLPPSSPLSSQPSDLGSSPGPAPAVAPIGALSGPHASLEGSLYPYQTLSRKRKRALLEHSVSRDIGASLGAGSAALSSVDNSQIPAFSEPMSRKEAREVLGVSRRGQAYGRYSTLAAAYDAANYRHLSVQDRALLGAKRLQVQQAWAVLSGVA